jgi:hypothetical protein
MPHRWMFMLSAVLAALVLAAMPVMALATDDCGDDDCDDDEPPAAVVTPAPPVPAPPPTQELTTVPSPTASAPAPVKQIRGERISSPASPKKATKHTRKTVHRQTTGRVVRVRTAAVSLQTIPQGGVQAGAGGTALTGPDELVFALAGGSLLLLTAGGGLLARARREDR